MSYARRTVPLAIFAVAALMTFILIFIVPAPLKLFLLLATLGLIAAACIVLMALAISLVGEHSRRGH